jgi:superoxide dismutase, Cu-Zn family
VINRSALAATAAAGTCLVVFSVATAGPAGAATSHREVHLAGNLSAAGGGSTFVSYDPQVAPLGARVSVALVDAGEGHTQVTLDVDGLLPDHGYAAHAHVNPCGATGADAGGHFQNTVDPAAGPDRPSTDPAYANAENEVWLDLETDGNGAGHAEADVPFAFDTRAPRSVVVHEDGPTATDAGHAGMAGARAACITLPARSAS